jgi:hypothetical protein
MRHKLNTNWLLIKISINWSSISVTIQHKLDVNRYINLASIMHKSAYQPGINYASIGISTWHQLCINQVPD